MYVAHGNDLGCRRKDVCRSKVDCLLNSADIELPIFMYIISVYSRTPVSRTLKGNKKQFELAEVRVIGTDCKIQLALLKIDSC